MPTGGPERGFYIHFGGIEQVRVRRRLRAGRSLRPDVARVALADIGQDVVERHGLAAAPELASTARGRAPRAVAVTKIFTSASGQITVPMSRPSSTAPRPPAKARC